MNAILIPSAFSDRNNILHIDTMSALLATADDDCRIELLDHIKQEAKRSPVNAVRERCYLAYLLELVHCAGDV